MNIIYFIGVLVIGFAVVMKLFYNKKSDGVNEKQIRPKMPEQVKPKVSKKIESEIPKQIKPEMPGKNMWLYPTDEFGQMEKGVVFESKTSYRNGLKVIKHNLED